MGGLLKIEGRLFFHNFSLFPEMWSICPRKQEKTSNFFIKNSNIA